MSSADAEEEPQRTPPAMVASSSTMPRSSATLKRARSGSSSGVRFHSVNVRTFGMEVWGGETVECACRAKEGSEGRQVMVQRSGPPSSAQAERIAFGLIAGWPS